MLDITIYGKPTSSYSYIKQNISMAAEKAGLEIALKEVNETENFIKDHIMSIPALKIGEELVLKGDKDITEYVSTLTNKILRTENYGTMNQLIVPVDLSDASHNAVLYAYELSKTLSAVVKIIHVYHPAPPTVNGIPYIDPSIEEIRRNEFNEYLDRLNQELHSGSGAHIHIQGEFLVGLAKTEILNYAESTPNSIIIMGSHGETGALKKMFGSVSTAVLQSSKSPVLVIPPNVSYRALDKVVFAVQDQINETEDIKTLGAWLKKYNSELHFLHIDELIKPENLKSISIPESLDELKAEFKVIDHINIESGISEYCSELNADLLVMERKERGFISSLFHKSITKAMAIIAQSPLLILHK